MIDKPVSLSACMAALTAMLLLSSSIAFAESGKSITTIRLEEVASGLSNPLYLTAPESDPRLFIVEQPGRIRIVKDGRLLLKPFLDIVDRISSGGERGLLSVAFHPRFSENGYFYVNYTNPSGDTHVERYTVSPDPDIADASSGMLVLAVDQPFANHNGGLVMFGPDGMLYVGMGDGGSGGDPYGNAQDRGTLLGDLLRIDVDGGEPYAIPADNPFVGKPGMRSEIWAWGLRNPWRFAFDPVAGLLYIADVGQNAWEEIDVTPIRAAGLNYGWNLMEGSHCYGTEPCDRNGLALPILEYGHADGCSITGGFVYRGSRIPSLISHYFYADYCRGWIRSFRYSDGKAVDQRTWNVANVGRVLSFGQDSSGELYVLSDTGRVYRIVPS